MVGSSACARTWHRATSATAAAPRGGTRPSWASPTPRCSPARGSLQDVHRSDSPRARRETPVAGRCAWPRRRPFRRGSRGGSRPRDSCRLSSVSSERSPCGVERTNRARSCGTYRRREERIGVAGSRQRIIETQPPRDRPMQASREMGGPCDDEREVAAERSHQEQALHASARLHFTSSPSLPQ